MATYPEGHCLFIREHKGSKKQDEKVYPIQEHTKLDTQKNYMSVYTVEYTRLMNTEFTGFSTAFHFIILLQNTLNSYKV
jgi:hypothetical protein